jgi:hypothetical protein
LTFARIGGDGPVGRADDDRSQDGMGFLQKRRKTMQLAVVDSMAANGVGQNLKRRRPVVQTRT